MSPARGGGLSNIIISGMPLFISRASLTHQCKGLPRFAGCRCSWCRQVTLSLPQICPICCTNQAGRKTTPRFEHVADATITRTDNMTVVFSIVAEITNVYLLYT